MPLRHPSLPRRLHQQETEIAALGKALAGLHAETGRLNALLAETTGLHTSLHEDNLLLEARATNQLKVRLQCREQLNGGSHHSRSGGSSTGRSQEDASPACPTLTPMYSLP